MKKNILYPNFQRNLHFTLLLRSLLSILLLFNSVLHTEIITIVNDLFFYPLWQCEVEENTDHNYSFSVCCILSLSVAVSLITVLCFFLTWGFGSFFSLSFVQFGHALRETVNKCIIHWTEEHGTHCVYLKFVSWCNKRWRSVVYLNLLLEGSLNACMYRDFFFFLFFCPPQWLRSSHCGSKCLQVLEGCKTKSFNRRNAHRSCPCASTSNVSSLLLSP